MIVVDEAVFNEEDLAHFGTKGMRWGRRKDGKPGSSHRALKIGGAALAAGGGVIAVAVLARNGKLPFSSASRARIENGRQSAARIADQAAWRKSVSSVLNDMKQANAEQDRWMRSLGLGAHVNKPF